MYRRLSGPQGLSGQVRKISIPPGFDPRTVQPVVNCHTDWPTRPTHGIQNNKYFYIISGYKTLSACNLCPGVHEIGSHEWPHSTCSWSADDVCNTSSWKAAILKELKGYSYFRLCSSRVVTWTEWDNQRIEIAYWNKGHVCRNNKL